jgi:hypothetical protein
VPGLLATRHSVSFRLKLEFDLLRRYMPQWQTIAVEQAEREFYIEPWFMSTTLFRSREAFIVGEYFCTTPQQNIAFVRARIDALICKPMGGCGNSSLTFHSDSIGDATLRQAGVASMQELREAKIGWVF